MAKRTYTVKVTTKTVEEYMIDAYSEQEAYDEIVNEGDYDPLHLESAGIEHVEIIDEGEAK